MSVRHLEIGSNVGHVDIVTLFEQVEGLVIAQRQYSDTTKRNDAAYERSFFVDNESDRVGENTMLKNDGVTDCSGWRQYSSTGNEESDERDLCFFEVR